MSFSTAFKISLLCLLALAMELVLSYFIFSSYAFYLAGEEGGRYSAPESYGGPVGTLAKGFYILMGFTAAGGILAPIIAVFTWAGKKVPRKSRPDQ